MLHVGCHGPAVATYKPRDPSNTVPIKWSRNIWKPFSQRSSHYAHPASLQAGLRPTSHCTCPFAPSNVRLGHLSPRRHTWSRGQRVCSGGWPAPRALGGSRGCAPRTQKVLWNSPFTIPPRRHHASALTAPVSQFERLRRAVDTFDQRKALSRLLLFGERALWHALTEYVTHFHEERPHQGKGNVVLMRPPHPRADWQDPIQCRERLGGLLVLFPGGSVKHAPNEVRPMIVENRIAGTRITVWDVLHYARKRVVLSRDCCDLVILVTCNSFK